MKKADELTDPQSSRARDDEVVFVLLGRDRAAADTIRHWVRRRIEIGENEPDDPQVVRALTDADEMEREAQPRAKADDGQVSFARASPAWFCRASAAAELSPGQRDRLLGAMSRELPVDSLLASVVERVDANIARSEGEETAEACRYGELVAVDVVLATARLLLGDVVETLGPLPPRRMVRIPPGTRLFLDRDLDAEGVYLAPGAELHCGAHAIPRGLYTEAGHAICLDPLRRVVVTRVPSKATREHATPT